jgi:hypothetical protein
MDSVPQGRVDTIDHRRLAWPRGTEHSTSTGQLHELVPREVVDKLMKKANPVWKVILGLSRYGGLRTP